MLGGHRGYIPFRSRLRNVGTSIIAANEVDILERINMEYPYFATVYCP